MTNRIFLILLSLVSVSVVSARDIQSFINDQLRTYPELRLIDIYKSCFQDYMGAEHMVTDSGRRVSRRGDRDKQCG